MDISVALFGRTNVGKSTLFNRLVPKGRALVDNTPHLTRDCRIGLWPLDPHRITLWDVPGWQSKPTQKLEATMQAHAQQVLQESQLVLWLCDAQLGVIAEDEALAAWLRKQSRRVILLMNKCETKRAQHMLVEAWRLGVGEALAISALHGSGLEQLEAKLREFISILAPPTIRTKDDASAQAARPLQMAILGRPNVGKSSLVNALAGARQLTAETAGTTREAVPILWQWDGQNIALYDTAGMRRRSRATGRLEHLARADTRRAIQFAEVVIVLLSVEQAFDKQDIRLLELVEAEGRAVVIGMNKTDIQHDKQLVKRRVARAQADSLQGLASIPIVSVSALKKRGLAALMRASLAQYQLWNSQLGTGVLNRWLAKAQAAHSPPLLRQPAKRARAVRLRYITQTRTRPPGFTIFGNSTDLPEAYLRYLRNDLQTHFKLAGVPIRLKLRQGNNPYAKGVRGNQ